MPLPALTMAAIVTISSEHCTPRCHVIHTSRGGGDAGQGPGKDGARWGEISGKSRGGRNMGRRHGGGGLGELGKWVQGQGGEEEA